MMLKYSLTFHTTSLLAHHCTVIGNDVGYYAVYSPSGELLFEAELDRTNGMTFISPEKEKEFLDMYERVTGRKSIAVTMERRDQDV